MSKEEMLAKVKDNLNLEDDTKDLMISDVIQDVMNYCNRADLPEAMEPFIRKKVKGIITYEAENGTSSVFDVKSVKEGDTSITYNVDEVSRETVYGLSKEDIKRLQEFRRLRR